MMYKSRLLELFYVLLFLCFLIQGDAQKKENEKYSIHIVGNIKDLPAGYFIDVKYLPHTCVGCPPFTSTKSYQGGFVLNFKIGSPMLVRVHISHQKIEGTEILDKNGDFRLLYLYLTKSGTVKIDGSFKDNSFSFSVTAQVCKAS